jgi:chromatin structure-remodeling complex protein RSC7
MLSTEPARCCGFRDSYLFFTKHMHLHKVIVDEDEKRDLIDRDVIPHSYKGRSIGVVTARSVFREFGARIVIGGKRVVDDYYAQAARSLGAAEGDLADPNDQLPPEGQPYNKNQYVAWHGASAVYHTNLPSVPLANGKPLPGKRKVQITSANWQIEHARASRYALYQNCDPQSNLRRSRFNSELAAERRRNWGGLYDPHTNLMHYPKASQPTHAKWEQLPADEVDERLAKKQRLNGHSNSPRTSFEPVSKVIARNFLVVDTVYVAPPHAGLGFPGPDGAFGDIGANGLPNTTPDILNDLPPDCRSALLAAKAQQEKWHHRFRGETEDGMRGQLKIGFMGFPV